MCPAEGSNIPKSLRWQHDSVNNVRVALPLKPVAILKRFLCRYTRNRLVVFGKRWVLPWLRRGPAISSSTARIAVRLVPYDQSGYQNFGIARW